MSEIRYMNALNQAMDEEMARDESVIIVGEDVGLPGGSFAITRGLLKKYGPERVKDTPISESAIVGLAIGSALMGLRPVIEIMFMDFTAVCMDQITNEAAKARYMFGGQMTLPIVIRTPCGGGVNAGPQHSQCLEAWFAHTPGLKVVMPSTPYDAKGLLKASIRDNNPVIFAEHKGLYRIKGEVPEGEYIIPLGKAEIKREGTDVTIVATSRTVFEAMAAAEKLQQDGISAEIVDPRTISPLDIDTIIGSVKKTNHLVIAHEAVKSFGLGAEIAALVQENAFDYLDAPIKRLGGAFSPIPFALPLEKRWQVSSDDIVQAVKEIVS